MRRLLFVAVLILLALWVAGCEIVESHYVGHRRGFHAPPPMVLHRRPMRSPHGYYDRLYSPHFPAPHPGGPVPRHR
ncbi:MAG: hypothetical protein KAY65_08310 [Planctomycetes bacterium]|nr:hypothetical protein [Planctomycetota bacterium]